jgi:glyoxylase I family protein
VTPPTFAGIDHIALTVTDLDVSTKFYRELLDFIPVLDFGYGRVLLHKSGFSLGLMKPPEGTGARFSELNTGVDHLGLAAASREELVEWEARLDAAGVTYTPIQDMELSYSLNFKDPDGIAWELSASTETYAAALTRLREEDLTHEEILAEAARLVGPDYVAKPD